MENLEPVPEVMKETMYVNIMYIMRQANNNSNTKTMQTLSKGLN